MVAFNLGDIPGYFDFEDIYREQVAIARPAAHFVEVGCWFGRSTAAMGTYIRGSEKPIRFDAIDTWQTIDVGYGVSDKLQKIATEHDGMYGAFQHYMKEAGVSDIVNPIVCDSVVAAKLYEDNSLDFVFIDGDHRRENVLSDLNAWWPKVRPGGVLAGHDFDDPGPHDAACAFCESNGLALGQSGRSFLIRKVTMTDEVILLGLPTYGPLNCNMAMAAIASSTASKHRIEVKPAPSSLLAASFNGMWCDALNNPKYTHFAMCHADFVPCNHWIDILMSEMHQTGADVVSVVSPLKDDRGITSCGIGHPTRWETPKKRFSMTEIMTFPETFVASDTGYPGEPLLMNTACWLADLRNPKWRETDENGYLKIYFTINDKIQKHPNGFLQAQVQSEDWFFSMRAHEAGLKIVLTRKVAARHYGEFGFPNNMAWGTQLVDEATKGNWDAGIGG